MLQKLKEDEEAEERPVAELGSLRNTDWVRRRGWAPGLCQDCAGAYTVSKPPQARLWVQLMRELRHGVKLKKVQEKQFNPLPTEYQLTPFEMLMQDIRARNYKLRKVMVSAARLARVSSLSCHCAGLDTATAHGLSALSQVDGDIPPRVKKDAHELILDFIRSRPPLKQVNANMRTPPWHGSAWPGVGGSHGCHPHSVCGSAPKLQPQLEVLSVCPTGVRAPAATAAPEAEDTP